MKAEPEITPEQNSAVTWGPVAAIVVTLATYFGSQILAGILLTTYVSLRGWSSEQASDWLSGSVHAQFFLTLIIEAFVLGILWLFLWHRKANFVALGLIRPKLRDLGYALAGFGVYFPLLLASSAVIKALAPHAQIDQKQNIGFQNADGLLPLAMVFVSLVVLPPLVEEILVRGFLYSGLRAKLPKVVAVIAASVIFAAAHLQFGGNAPLVWSAAIDTFVLSLVLISLREITDGLWASIFLHMTKNGLAFAMLFIFKMG